MEPTSALFIALAIASALYLATWLQIEATLWPDLQDLFHRRLGLRAFIWTGARCPQCRGFWLSAFAVTAILGPTWWAFGVWIIANAAHIVLMKNAAPVSWLIDPDAEPEPAPGPPPMPEQIEPAPSPALQAEMRDNQFVRSMPVAPQLEDDGSVDPEPEPILHDHTIDHGDR